MTIITRLFLACALLVFLPTIATAQMEELKSSTPEERATLQTQWMKTALSLDAKAGTAVADINLKYARENQSLMDSNSPKLGKLITFHRNSEAKDAQLKTILTPQQYTLYEQKKSEMEEKMKQKLVEKHQATQ